MPATICFLFALFLSIPVQARDRSGVAPNSEFPWQHWRQVGKPEELGWSTEKLAAAKAYADSMDTAAVMIIDDGVVVSQWGETTKRYKCHSVRKSFLSALYGVAVARKEINLSATLGQLGIDDNWDFNALGTIYESATHDSIYHSFDERIARRIGMEDYVFKDQEYITGPDSIHRAYPFRMTARDMARFGLLYLREGRWRDQQIIPNSWVRESTTAYSVADGNTRDGYSGYGYLWWVAVNGNH